MNIEIINFDEIKIEKRKFHHLKNLNLLEDVDIEKIKLSYIMFAKKSAYVKICYIGIKWIYFFIENDKLFEKYDSI